ncbi:cobalamin-binding protein [Rhodocaloribacter sp.]
MRIVSLLPATTEWVCAFGASEALVGRSHACDFPPSIRCLPALTHAAFDAGDGGSSAIDTGVRRRLREGLSLYEVDLERLRALRPDLVLTQAQCAVCAVDVPQLEAALAEWTDGRPRIFSMEPMTFKEVLNAALRLGRELGCAAEAMRVVAEGERRLRMLRERLGIPRSADPATFPTVACIEWMEPVMTAGHWMPDVAERAGGRAVLADAATPSRCVAWDDLRAADPDVIAVMPCGFPLERTRRDLHLLTSKPGWASLRAVRNGRVFLFDGNAYFNRPGPRLYRAAELLAAALHPDRVPARALSVAAWEMEPLG